MRISISIEDREKCLNVELQAIFDEEIIYMRVSRNSKWLAEIMTNRNSQGFKEFCGRCTAIPLVKLAEETYSPPDFPPKLEWYKFKSQRDCSGSVLAAFELIEVRVAILIDIRLARETQTKRERKRDRENLFCLRANEPFCHLLRRLISKLISSSHACFTNLFIIASANQNTKVKLQK